MGFRPFKVLCRPGWIASLKCQSKRVGICSSTNYSSTKLQRNNRSHFKTDDWSSHSWISHFMLPYWRGSLLSWGFPGATHFSPPTPCLLHFYFSMFLWKWKRCVCFFPPSCLKYRHELLQSLASSFEVDLCM